MYLKSIPYYALFGYFQPHYVSATMLTEWIVRMLLKWPFINSPVYQRRLCVVYENTSDTFLGIHNITCAGHCICSIVVQLQNNSIKYKQLISFIDGALSSKKSCTFKVLDLPIIMYINIFAVSVCQHQVADSHYVYVTMDGKYKNLT